MENHGTDDDNEDDSSTRMALMLDNLRELICY